MTFDKSFNKFPFKDVLFEIYDNELKKMREIKENNFRVDFIMENSAVDLLIKNLHVLVNQYFHHIIYSLKVSLLKTGDNRITPIIAKDLILRFIYSSKEKDLSSTQLKPFFIASNLVLNGKKSFHSKFPEECVVSKMIHNHFRINMINKECEYEEFDEIVDEIFDNIKILNARNSILKNLKSTKSINNFALLLVMRVAKEIDSIISVYDSTKAKNYLDMILNVIQNPIFKSDIPHHIERIIAISTIAIVQSGYCVKKSQNRLVKRASNIFDLIFGGKHITLTWRSLATIFIQACEIIFQQKNRDGFSLTIFKLFSIFELIKQSKIFEYEHNLKINIFIKYNLQFVELEQAVISNTVEYTRLAAIVDSIFYKD